MSDNQSQTQSKVMERIAFAAVIVFALGITYAIHITQQTVNAIQTDHYGDTEVVTGDINATTSVGTEIDQSTGTPAGE